MNAASTTDSARIARTFLGRGRDDVIAMPNLVDIQLSSYERFLQRQVLAAGQPPARQGLEEVFQEIFPVESPNGDMVLEYVGYTLDESGIKLTEQECRNKRLSHVIPLKARINLIFWGTGEIRQKEIYMGDLPLMTGRGTFIINGAERVVVSQIHRSPGVIFSHEKGAYTSRIIPYRGSWLEFEIDQKNELLYAKIDRKKRLLATMFLRALGYDGRESIIELFYRTTSVTVDDSAETKKALIGSAFSKAVYRRDGDAQKKLYRAGEKIHPHDVEELLHSGIETVEIIDLNHPESLHSEIILNCFEREESRQDGDRDEPTREDAIAAVYQVIKPGEPITIESAEKDLENMFFSARRYDLGRVGRYKLNKKFDYEVPKESHTLDRDDIVATMKFLVRVYIGEGNIDDIDHLGFSKRCYGN